MASRALQNDIHCGVCNDKYWFSRNRIKSLFWPVQTFVMCLGFFLCNRNLIRFVLNFTLYEQIFPRVPLHVLLLLYPTLHPASLVFLQVHQLQEQLQKP